MNRDLVTLAQILERIERIEGSGLSRELFFEHPWDQDALIRNLEVIGEASKRLSTHTKAMAPEVEWKLVAGYRDVATHGYDQVSLDRTWALVERNLPALKRSIHAVLKKLEPRR